MADLTGLPPERLNAGLDDVADLLTAEGLANANPAARELLADHLGGDICGFLSDVERLLGSGTESPQLSVAFSSYLAGVFLAGELLKASAGMTSPLAGRYQIDPLATLTPGAPFLQRPSPTCFCQVRRSAVRAVRARRPRMGARSTNR